MTKNILRAALLAGSTALVACAGGENDAGEAALDVAKVETKQTESAAEAPSDSGALEIPDAPANPLIEINAKKSEEYLAANAAKDGVRTLENGIQIETLTAGKEQMPGEEDFIRFHYTGKFIDGTVFDDSTVLEDPIVVPSYTAIPIPGVPEALAQMKEGETAQVTIPPVLAFGEEGLPGVFEPNQTLIFDINLIEVVTAYEEDRRNEIIAEQEAKLEEQRKAQEEAQKAAMEAFQAQAAENLSASEAFLEGTGAQDGVTTTESGLQFEVLEDGGKGETPDP